MTEAGREILAHGKNGPRGRYKYDDIVHKDQGVLPSDLRKDYVKFPLKGPGHVLETEGNADETEETVMKGTYCLVAVVWNHVNLPIPLVTVQGGEYCSVPQ